VKDTCPRCLYLRRFGPHGEFIIPYGLADHATGFATVPAREVLEAMRQEARRSGMIVTQQKGGDPVARGLANASPAVRRLGDSCGATSPRDWCPWLE